MATLIEGFETLLADTDWVRMIMDILGMLSVRGLGSYHTESTDWVRIIMNGLGSYHNEGLGSYHSEWIGFVS